MNARKELLGGLAAIILSAWIVLGSFSIALIQTGVIKVSVATAVPTNPPTTSPLPTVLPGTPSPTTAPTHTPTHTQTPTPPANCLPPEGWTAYTTLPGDTLAQLAVQFGTSVNMIMVKNCMAVPNVTADVIIYLPPLIPTSNPTPEATPTLVATAASTHPVIVCGAPAGWISYVVKSGDTLFHLAILLDISVPQLQLANCLGSSTLIVSGQILHIPHALPSSPTPPTPTVTPKPSKTITPSATSPSSTPVVNNPPTLNPLANLTIAENAGLQTVSLSGISSGAPAEHNPLTIIANSSNPGVIPNPSVQYTSPNISGTITFTPLPNTYGSATISVTVNDGQSQKNTITRSFIVTVTQVNTPPVANNQSVTTPQDKSLSITLTASDVDGDPLTFTIVTTPAHGTLTGSAPNLTYQPAAGYFGADTFTFKANDGKQFSNTATVSITVTQTNQPPVAANLSVSTAQGTPVSITLTANDPEGRLLSYAIVSPPSHGSLSGTPPGVTYTPDATFAGQDTFTFKANDGFLDSNIAKVSITVTAANLPPVALGQAVSTPINTSIIITLSATDPENQTLTYSIVSTPINGALSLAIPNVTYTPSPGYTGPDSFTFKANDGTLDSNIVTISITVTQPTPLLSSIHSPIPLPNLAIDIMDIPLKPNAI